MLRKRTLVRRDKEVNDSVRKGRRTINKVIYNGGQREDLKIAADEVYETVIKQDIKKKETIREKYKVEVTPQKLNIKRKERFKDQKRTR